MFYQHLFILLVQCGLAAAPVAKLTFDLKKKSASGREQGTLQEGKSGQIHWNRSS